MKTPILAILTVLLFAQAASADILKKAEITAVINDVKLLEANAHERGAKIKDVVQGETAVKTGVLSRSELLFQDKTLTRLGANSLFSFTQGTRDLELEHGTMLLQCPKGVGGARIRTAAVTAAIAGTTIMIEYSPPALPKRKPGYIPIIAEMTPEEALAELQHPHRNYTKPEHHELEAKARQVKKGGGSGYVKVLVLEGTLRLFLNNQLGNSVLITPGHMVIMNPNADTIPPAVAFDIQKLMKTSLLVSGWGGGATDLNKGRITYEEDLQDQRRASGDLLDTNLLIPGAGTVVTTVSVAIPAITYTFQPPTPVGGPPIFPGPPIVPPSPPPPLPPSPTGPLVAITSPNPYPIGPTTTFTTDPSVTINGITSKGTIYHGGAIDGLAPSFYFGSSNVIEQIGDPFDGGLESYALSPAYNVPPAGDAVFEFSDLTITGQPVINTTGGAVDMSLLSEGTISTGPAVGTINLDALDGLFLGTVNSSIILGSGSFTSTRTVPAIPGFTPFNGDHRDLYLEIYARGASSDLHFDGTAGFVDRALLLEAGRDVVVNGSISVQPVDVRNSGIQFDVGITAGNDFILGPAASIITRNLSIDATDVMGIGVFSVISAQQISISLANPITLTQSGTDLMVNTLRIDGTALQSQLALSSNQGFNIPANLSWPGSGNGFFNFSSGATMSINGTVSAQNLFLSAQDLVPGANALIHGTPSVIINLTETASAVDLSQASNRVFFRSLPIDSANLSNLSLGAPSIQISTDLNIPAIDLNLQGSVNSSGNITARSVTFDSFLAGSSASPSVTDTVNGNINAPSGLSIPYGSLTVGGTVTANVVGLTDYFYGNTTALNASSVSAPGGLSFAGASGGGQFSAGSSLTLTVNSASFGTSTFDGGDAPTGSGLPGGSGGSLTVNSTSDLAINSKISATTGANDTGVSSGGSGGTVSLTSSTGAVTVAANTTVQVSSNDVPNRKVSRQGGNILLQTGKTSGISGINVANSAQLLSLLNATAPGPGGTVQLISAGADINVDGKIQADRGTIDIHNNGASGNVNITSGAQLSADVIKAGALGSNGQLIISAGSQINANSMLKLYGGSTSGIVLFTGNGTVNISGGQIHIAANTVQISGSTHVNNSGSTFVYAPAPNRIYGIGAGGGNFQNPVTAGPLSGRPAY